jgi:hypothetical protein
MREVQVAEHVVAVAILMGMPAHVNVLVQIELIKHTPNHVHVSHDMNIVLQSIHTLW